MFKEYSHRQLKNGSLTYPYIQFNGPHMRKSNFHNREIHTQTFPILHLIVTLQCQHVNYCHSIQNSLVIKLTHDQHYKALIHTESYQYKATNNSQIRTARKRKNTI